jgi:hypothetical protein
LHKLEMAQMLRREFSLVQFCYRKRVSRILTRLAQIKVGRRQCPLTKILRLHAHWTGLGYQIADCILLMAAPEYAWEIQHSNLCIQWNSTSNMKD